MQEQTAIAAIRAFSSPTRRTVFRRLIRANPQRMTVDDLANALSLQTAPVEQHLNQFEQAGLVCSRHDGRTVDYAIDYHATSELWGFLMANCCQGNPDFCGHGRAASCC